MNRSRLVWSIAAMLTLVIVALSFTQAIARDKQDRGRTPRENDEVIRDFARAQLEQGREIFRFATFGDGSWWGGELQLHRAIEGAAHSDDVSSSVRDHKTLNAAVGDIEPAIDPVARTGGLSIWPLPAAAGDAVQIAFLSPAHNGRMPPGDLSVGVFDLSGRQIAELGSRVRPAEHDMMSVSWDGKDAGGAITAPGVYFVRAAAPSVGFQTERRIVVR
jgi:hypothetical protein